MALLVAFFTAVIFAISDLLYRALGQSVGAWLLSGLSNGVLLIAASIILLVRRQSIVPQQKGLCLALALVRTVTIVLAMEGLKGLPVAQFYLVLYLFPLWVVLLGIPLGYKPRRRQLVALVVALVGVWVVFFKGGLTLGGSLVAALGCGVSLACQILLTRHLRQESFVRVAWINSAVGTVVGLGLAAALGQWKLAVPLASIGWPLGILLGLSILSPLGQTFAAQRIKPAAYAIFSYLQIPMALIGAYLVFGEALTGPMWLGIVLVTAGSLWAQLGAKKE